MEGFFCKIKKKEIHLVENVFCFSNSLLFMASKNFQTIKKFIATIEQK